MEYGHYASTPEVIHELCCAPKGLDRVHLAEVSTESGSGSTFDMAWGPICRWLSLSRYTVCMMPAERIWRLKKRLGVVELANILRPKIISVNGARVGMHAAMTMELDSILLELVSAD